MKKFIYILCKMLLIIIAYKGFSYYDGYRLDVDDLCITREKIEEKSKEYEKYIFDENGKRKLDDYANLTKAMYKEMGQNNKYKIFILPGPGEEKVHIRNPQELNNHIFIGILMKRYLKNDVAGQWDFLLIEDVKTGEEVFRMKRYQIYPYKRMLNTTYSSGASVIVQFKCKIYGK